MFHAKIRLYTLRKRKKHTYNDIIHWYNGYHFNASSLALEVLGKTSQLDLTEKTQEDTPW